MASPLYYQLNLTTPLRVYQCTLAVESINCVLLFVQFVPLCASNSIEDGIISTSGSPLALTANGDDIWWRIVTRTLRFAQR